MGEVTDRVEVVIRDLIDELEPGGRLPSERELAARTKAGRTTVRLVMTRLVMLGLVLPVQGRGTFVVGGPR